MLSEKVIEQLVERLVARVEEGNTYTLKKIGESIKKIGTLSETSMHRLEQIIKYGGSYEEIVKRLSSITDINVKDIYKMFDEVAKKDYEFAEQFYKYRGIDYIPYEQNTALRRQVRALAKLSAKDYMNIANTKTLGFSLTDLNGDKIFKGLKQTYYDLVDTAILNVSQGKTTFNDEMFKIMKELGSSGLKSEYESGYARRLDSTLRMNMQGALRNLHNEVQKYVGEEFESDGVEISVHTNPAPDHAEVQGRQFSNEEFEKFQNDKDSVDYQGKKFPAEFEGHDRRSISEHNCYHYIFSIVLGVNTPNYSNEQLQAIINKNNDGFEIDGKHYTMYQGTQMQRRLETAIRTQKDIQIMAREADNNDLILDAQSNITKLSQKYKELCDISGLPRKATRLRVSNYKRVAKSKLV